MGGIISATVLAVFFVFVMRLFGRRKIGVDSREASARSVPMAA